MLECELATQLENVIDQKCRFWGQGPSLEPWERQGKIIFH